MSAFILLWLLVFDACQLRTPAPPPQPIVYEEEVAPEVHHPVEHPQEAAPKNMSEHKHLELLEDQLDWMQKRMGNERRKWNDE